MLQDLGALDGQTFTGKQRRYEVLGALLGGVILPALTFPTLLSLAKWIPVIGTAIGVLVLPEVRIQVSGSEAGGGGVGIGDGVAVAADVATGVGSAGVGVGASCLRTSCSG